MANWREHVACRAIAELVADESGSNAIEYSLIGALTAITCMAILTKMSSEISTGWQSIGTAMATATTP
ncbi:MAG: Flp family type IVb pilin [Geminicoccaceae bacterium]